MKPDELHENVLKARSEFYETNDCTVQAIALATGEGYEMAHYAMQCAGRLPRKGSSIGAMKRAAHQLGFSMTRVPLREYSAKTAISLERNSLKGAYIVEFKWHVAAMVGGKVLDWVQGRRFRLLSLYKIEKISQKP